MTTNEIRKIQIDLSRSILGVVADVGDVGYNNTINIDNSRITQEPCLVVLPATVKDVSEVIMYCSKNQIKLTTKSGGHSATGYCLNSEGIVLDLGGLNSITLGANRTLKVGSGNRWIRIYNFLRDRQSDLCAIGGGCAGVGVAGFTLGGGYSFISRSYGLGSDNVSGMEFISVNGDVINLSDKNTDQNEKDLYWALRGCGGGNLGVVTSIDLELQKTEAPRLMMGQVSFPFYRIEEILDFYNKWAPALPNELAVYGMMRRFPDPRQGGRPILALRFTPVFNGKLSEGIDLLKPLTELAPDSVELYSMNLPEWENFIGTATQIKGNSAYIRSLVLPTGSLDSDVATICKKYLSRAPSNDSYIVWTHTGGKIKKNTVGSYAHRDGAYTFELKSVWNAAQAQQARPNIQWAVDFFDELGSSVQKARGSNDPANAYLNYIDPLLLGWQKSYYGKHYNKLKAIKDHWDPNGQFDFQQGIGSTYTASRTKPLDLSPLTRTFHNPSNNL